MKIDRRNSTSALFVFVTSSFLISCGGGSSNPDTIAGETARQCYDESYLKNTTATWDFTYEQLSNNTPTPVISSRKYQAESLSGVFGEANNLIVLNESGTSLASSTAATSSNKKFLRLQDDGTKTVFGLIASGKTGMAQSNTVESYSPAYTDSTPSLKKGETATIRITGRRETTVIISDTTTTEGPIDSTRIVKYVGNETIDTAAGKFNVCHFEVDGQQEWIWRGFPIQFTEGNGLLSRVNSVKLNNQIFQP